MPTVYELAEAQKRRIVQRERRAASALTRAYALVYQRTQARVAAITAEIDDAGSRGEVVSSSFLYERDRLARLQSETEAELREFSQVATRRIRDEQLAAIRLAAVDTRALIASSLDGSGGTLGASLSGLDRAAAENLTAFLGSGSPVRELFDGAGRAVSLKARDELVAGVAEGAPARVIASRIKDAFGGGLARALTVSRTETLRAYREATREVYQANSDVLEGWAWTATLTGRTCSMCWAMHGRIFQTSVRMYTHPNCRCVMVPIVRGAKRPKTGVEHFAEQEEGVQRAILGKGKFEAYRTGGLRLSDLVATREDARFGTVRFERSLIDIGARGTGPQTVQSRSVKKIEAVGSNDESDPLLTTQVGIIIARDPIAARLYGRMQKAGVRVELRYDEPLDRRTFGEYDSAAAVVRVFMRNNVTAQEAVSTIVHEGRHVTRRMRRRPMYSFAEEMRARALEFGFRNRRRPTLTEREILRAQVREAYPDIAEDEQR